MGGRVGRALSWRDINRTGAIMALSDYETALVTGASSGFGRAVATALAGHGLTVHAAARRGDRLEELAAETGCIAHVVDLRDATTVASAFHGLEVDVLVNNAGVGRGMASLTEAAPEDVEATLETNVLGTARVLHAVLPGMVERKRGHVVNIGSIFGLHALGSTLYGTAKGAIHLMSQNLRLELAGTGVRVTEICPGRGESEFLEKAWGAERAAELVAGIEILTAEDVAEAVIYALDVPWRVNVSLIELTPTEQIPGGLTTAPVAMREQGLVP
jgi:NADP-dependent 3-hydroxy acid dehydrogenase YdfG